MIIIVIIGRLAFLTLIRSDWENLECQSDIVRIEINIIRILFIEVKVKKRYNKFKKHGTLFQFKN